MVDSIGEYLENLLNPPSPPGVIKLSQVQIDVDKDWNKKKIYNLGEISVG